MSNYLWSYAIKSYKRQINGRHDIATFLKAEHKLEAPMKIQNSKLMYLVQRELSNINGYVMVLSVIAVIGLYLFF